MPNDEVAHDKSGASVGAADTGEADWCAQIEQTRLNIVHQVYLLLLDGQLTQAPLASDPQRVLDLGTGIGECTCGARHFSSRTRSL